MLGSSADGGFGRLSADTLITGFELQFETWSLTAEAELGWTLAEYRGGIIGAEWDKIRAWQSVQK